MFNNWRPVPTWFWIALALVVAFFLVPLLLFGAGGTY